MKLLDLFCGRWGWSQAFAARGWECVGVDLVDPPSVPDGCTFLKADILRHDFPNSGTWDFIVASPPCQQFSVHGMRHFHPNPPYPTLGLELFNRVREQCEQSRIPYVMENVRAAQRFVGYAIHHCGPFYLWGSAVPPLMPQNITKKQAGATHGDSPGEYRPSWSGSKARKAATAAAATIPPELAACVAAYAERILEFRRFHAPLG